jgi:hypothetical protein
MKIIWKPYEMGGEALFNSHNLGGLGGFFNIHVSGQRWIDYISRWPEASHPYLEAIRKDVVERGLRQGGFWHQDESQPGVPHFEDGAFFQASMRGWGDLMAAIWSEEEDHDHCYTHFAWDACEKEMA